jgi:hypothetical protein
VNTQHDIIERHAQSKYELSKQQGMYISENTMIAAPATSLPFRARRPLMAPLSHQRFLQKNSSFRLLPSLSRILIQTKSGSCKSIEREAIWYCKRDLRFPTRRAVFLQYRLVLVMVRTLSRIHPPIFPSLNICLSFLSSLSLAQLGRELHLRKLRRTLWAAGDGSLKPTTMPSRKVSRENGFE